MMKRFVTIGMLVTVATLFGEVSFSALNIGGAEYVTGVTHPEFRAATNALWQAKQDKRIIHYCIPSGGSSRAFVETAAEMREIIKKTGEPAFCQVDNAYLLSMYSAAVSPSGNEFLANFRAPCDMSRDYILSLSITNNPSGVAYISAITFGLTNRMPLKTVNGNSLIGSGNIVIEGGGGSNPDKITNLTSVITAEGKIITRPNASSVTWTTNTLLSTASHAVTLKEDYDNSAYTVFDVAQHRDVRPTLSDGAYGAAFGYYSLANGNYSFAAGYKATANSDRSFVWSGTSSSTGYAGFGDGTFSINPAGGLSGFYVGDNNMNSILGGYVPTTRTVAGKQLNANVSLGTLTLGSQTYDGSANVTLDMSGYVPTSRTVNGKALTDNISLTKDDVGVDDTKLWSSNHLQYVNGNCEIYESFVLDYIYTNGVSMIESLVPSYMTFSHTQSNVWTAIKDGNTYTMTVTPDEWTAGATNFVLLKNGEQPCPQNDITKYDGDDTEIEFAGGGVTLYKSETGREFRKKTELTTSNTVENIVAASLIKATNSMLRPSYIRVVNGINENIIHADMRYESSILVTNGIFREKTYSSLLGRYVTNELTWIEAYSGWGNPVIRPPSVKILKDGDGYKYVTSDGYVGGEPVSFSGEWQEMPYYYLGDLPPPCKGTNWLQYVWRTNVTVQTIATIENVQAMTNDATIVRGSYNPMGLWEIKVESCDVADHILYDIPWYQISYKPETLSGYGITNAYTKAYVDANFLKDGGTVKDRLSFRKDGLPSMLEIDNANIAFSSEADMGYLNNPKILFGGALAGRTMNFRFMSSDKTNDFVFVKAELDRSKYDYTVSQLKTDGSPVATSNMVERVIASKPAPSPLTGRTYDFHNGSNFTKRVYTALTNVIQTLGGTVTNPPTFN